MSTDHQRYSIDNQTAAIRSYAELYGLEVVRTFSDAGKSGLTFEGRPGLRTLIEVVGAGAANFEVLLVYDVSRWGRFQDVDEGAYYEFLCKHAGLRVVYVAEKFESDASGFSSVLKALKRIMAAEFSRDLSGRIFYAQSRVARRGYRAGAPAGFAMARLLVDENGQARGILEPGQRKAVIGERIQLVPGDEREVAVVRQIFDMWVHHAMSQEAIAQALRDESHPASSMRRWTPHAVAHILRNPKYAGHNVYGRTTHKLKTKPRAVPSSEWVIAAHAFPPIVDQALFDAAQQRFRRLRPPCDDLIEHLRRVLAQHGYLTASLIAAVPDGPRIGTYIKRFGRLTTAYRLAGFDYETFRSKDGKSVIPLADLAVSELEVRLLFLRKHRARRVYQLEDGCRISLRSFIGFRRPNGIVEWKVKLRWPRRSEFLVVARLAPEGDRAIDFLLLPKAAFAGSSIMTTDAPATRLEPYRFDRLEVLLDDGLGVDPSRGWASAVNLDGVPPAKEGKRRAKAHKDRMNDDAADFRPEPNGG